MKDRATEMASVQDTIEMGMYFRHIFVSVLARRTGPTSGRVVHVEMTNISF